MGHVFYLQFKTNIQVPNNSTLINFYSLHEKKKLLKEVYIVIVLCNFHSDELVI